MSDNIAQFTEPVRENIERILCEHTNVAETLDPQYNTTTMMFLDEGWEMMDALALSLCVSILLYLDVIELDIFESDFLA